MSPRLLNEFSACTGVCKELGQQLLPGPEEVLAGRLMQMARQLYSAGLGASGSLVVGEACR